VSHLAQEEEDAEDDEEYDGQDDGEGKPRVSPGTGRGRPLKMKNMKARMTVKAKNVSHLAQEEEDAEDDEEYDGQDDGEGQPCVSPGAGRERRRRL